MLIIGEKKYVETSFTSEEEWETVVEKHYEHIFGPLSVYLPKQLVSTKGGEGAVPDGFVQVNIGPMADFDVIISDCSDGKLTTLGAFERKLTV